LKGYLLDTSIALTAVDQPQRLTKGVRRALDRGPAFLSVMAYWEVMIKSMNGTLQVGDPRQWWQETLAALSLLPLSWAPRACCRTLRLAVHPSRSLRSRHDRPGHSGRLGPAYCRHSNSQVRLRKISTAHLTGYSGGFARDALPDHVDRTRDVLTLGCGLLQALQHLTIGDALLR
jgi:PIN domain nuclease of toxin-antitoxin system